MQYGLELVLGTPRQRNIVVSTMMGCLVPGDAEWVVCIQVTLDSGSARLAVFIVAASWSRTELGLIGSFVLMVVGSLAIFTHSLRTELDLNGKAQYTAIPSAIDGSDVRL